MGFSYCHLLWVVIMHVISSMIIMLGFQAPLGSRKDPLKYVGVRSCLGSRLLSDNAFGEAVFCFAETGLFRKLV